MAIDAKANEDEEKAKSVTSAPKDVTWVNLPTLLAQPAIPHRASDNSLGSTVAVSQAKALDSSASSSIDKIEKQEYIWSGYKDDEIPEKTNGRIVRNLRHQIFSLYRRLFSVVFLTNLAILIWILVTKEYNANRLGGIVVANVFIGVLMRQELVINAFFLVFTAIPSSYVLLFSLDASGD